MMILYKDFTSIYKINCEKCHNYNRYGVCLFLIFGNRQRDQVGQCFLSIYGSCHDPALNKKAPYINQ